jgi:DNA-binding CsgD family transcriptional regulator
MIDDLERLKDLEDQRVGLQFKVTQLMEMVDGFRDEIRTIGIEMEQIYAALGRPAIPGTSTSNASGFGFTRSEEAVVFYMRQRPPLSNKEIAEKLNISERTAKFHVQNIYRKLGIEPCQTAAGTYVPGATQRKNRVIAMQKLSGF